MRVAPVYVAGISLVIHVLATVIRTLRKTSSNAHNASAQGRDLHANIKSLGGTTIYAFKVVRGLCVIVLLSLYAYDLLGEPSQLSTQSKFVQLALFLTYVRGTPFLSQRRS